MNSELKTILVELRQHLEELYGEQLVKIVLFGSQARGDARPDSDIDVLIVLANPFNYSNEIERTSKFIADLCLKHNTLVSRAFVEQRHFWRKNSAFMRNVRREGLAI